ncbi:unnamed protein product [Anisakis simplex]|uniref:Intraflagellar transport protein 46 homolog n=1 Tax=Anisakis simplex TaxID=6269 RepID=A0A0M3J6G9_ANISI|nr:unnamed protein product [Anisakis simplex]
MFPIAVFIYFEGSICGYLSSTNIAPLGTDERQLLQFIEAYTAETITIEPILKPFLLDYIPAVGDIDAFIKIPRPDEVEDNLGLTVLDEPSAKQSDPTILGMQLRNDAKDVITTDAPVKKLDRADKNTREIEQWVTNIKVIPANNEFFTNKLVKFHIKIIAFILDMRDIRKMILLTNFK